ncbi:hypothetical protein KHA80_14320 [Anaerobacillus sp. HL2]|nr:hypothetical protein KHA80_14320 [Anaerobacillus sp. HL2]
MNAGWQAVNSSAEQTDVITVTPSERLVILERNSDIQEKSSVHLKETLSAQDLSFKPKLMTRN